jgi:hypothetical protein
MMIIDGVNVDDIQIDLSFLEKDRLVLHNDDHNGFYHVMACLVVIVDISAARAYEIAIRTHSYGSSIIMYDDSDKNLSEIGYRLTEHGLSCTLESIHKNQQNG